MKIDEKLNKTKLMLWAHVGKRTPSWEILGLHLTQ